MNKRIDVVQRLRRNMVLRIGIAMLQGAREEHASAIDTAAKEMALDVDIVELASESKIFQGPFEQGPYPYVQN